MVRGVRVGAQMLKMAVRHQQQQTIRHVRNMGVQALALAASYSVSMNLDMKPDSDLGGTGLVSVGIVELDDDVASSTPKKKGR